MAGKIKLQKPKNIGEVTDHVGNILAWAVLLIYFTGLPLYYKDGYTLIASNKYLYLMYTAKYIAIAMGVFLLVRMSFWGYSKDEIACYKATYKTDIFVLSFILLSVLSHFCSSFKSGGESYFTDWFIEGSLWGTRGWYMGLVSYLVFAMFYLILSKLLRHTYFAYIPILLTVTLVSMWGILNRYKIAPINMNNDYGEGAFIASLGNINWFCGYTSVIVPLGWGLYMGAKKLWIKVLLSLVNAITFYMIFVNNSDSGIFALFVTMAVLLGFSFTQKERLMAFTELIIFMLIPASLIGLMDVLFKGKRTGASGIIEFFYGKPAFISLLIVLIFYTVFFYKVKEFPEEIMKKIKKVYVIFVPSVFSLFVLLIIINTLSGGKLPVIGGKDVFMFKAGWGSGRGETWLFGLRTFASMNPWHKLIGSGPDTFYFELIKYPELKADLDLAFGGARLTNAHNEWISLLVNNGILGLCAFIGMLVSGVKTSFKYAKENLYIIGFALSIISYTANNMFSFEQITNTPFLFLVLGLEGAAIARVLKKGASLTKSGRNTKIQRSKNKKK